MFDSAEDAPPAGALRDENWFDPAGLSDAALIDTVVRFDRIASWASARQATLLAEFARRRTDSSPTTLLGTQDGLE